MEKNEPIQTCIYLHIFSSNNRMANYFRVLQIINIIVQMKESVKLENRFKLYLGLNNLMLRARSAENVRCINSNKFNLPCNNCCLV